MEGANMERKAPEIRRIENVITDICAEIENALNFATRINEKLLTPTPVSNEAKEASDIAVPHKGWFDETIDILKTIRRRLKILNRRELSKLARAVDADKVVGKVEPMEQNNDRHR